MLRKTMVSRTLILSLLVVLLMLGLSAVGCGGRESPAPAPPPTLLPEAAPALTPVSTSSVPSLVAADFDTCTGTNNLGGAMGAAYNPPDSLKENYQQEANRGCVARLEYKIADWTAFWMKLQGADLRPYSKLVFDVKADPQAGIPRQMKFELNAAARSASSISRTSWPTGRPSA